MPEDKIQADAIEENERDTPEYWRKWLKSARKAAKEHWADSKDAWSEYEKRQLRTDRNYVDERPYPIYWSSCKVLEPAYYSRTPKLTSRRRFDIKDDVALTASLILERLGTYLVDQSDFDAVMQAAVQDFIHADKTAIQLIYSHDEDKLEERVGLVQLGDEYTDESGQPWSEEVFQDDQGFFGKSIGSMPVNQRITLSALPYDEILHTPDAKCESEIQEKAFYFYMSKEDAKARFPGKEIQWKSKKDGGSKEHDEDSLQRDRVESMGEYLEGWEVYSKPNKRVYWVSDQCPGGFLDSKDDPYGLVDFFPATPFIIGSKPSKSLYPTPSFIQLAPLIDELHTAAGRVTKLTKAIRRRALVSGDETLVMALENLGDGEFVAAEHLLQKVLEKGGVDNLVWYIPVKELVSSISELTTLQDKFKNEFYEWFGVPDILRGATEPLESATAQQLKAESAHDRFKWQKKQVQTLARNSIEMMCDLALEVFDDVKMGACIGYDFLSPEDQQRFPQAIELLRNDDQRNIRLEIEADSLSFVDEQLRAQQVNQAVGTLTQGLDSISRMMQQSPDVAAVGLQALLLSLDTLPAGREFHDEVRQTVQQLIDQAKKPKQPGPDYEQMKLDLQRQKLETDMQKAQFEAQATQWRDQMEAQAQMRELDRKDYELQLKAGTESAKVQIEQVQQQTQNYIQQVMLQLEAQRVQIEEFKAQIQAQESMMEEIRLASEVDVEKYRIAVEAAQTSAPETLEKPEQSPIVNVINVQKDREIPVPIIPELI